MSSSAKRVLIIGAERTDTVGDSFRRALAGHYAVEIVDPYDLITFTPPRWTGLYSRTVSGALQTLANIVTREPLSYTFPQILRTAREFGPDIVLVTTVDALPPRIVKELRGGNPSTRVIGVFSDAISNFGRGYFFESDYDALFFKDHYIVDKLRAKLGWRHVFYLPQACDPILHRPVELTAEDHAKYGCDITVAGNLHYFRLAQMRPLAGRSMKLYGGYPPRWVESHPVLAHHMRYEVTGDLKCRAMRAAKIVLNNNHYAEIAGTNKRTFECAAMGAFQLTDTPALRDVFVPGEEVATFDTHAEMLERIDYYIARPDLRERMCERAQVRAMNEHTYAHRWAAMAAVAGIPIPASFPIQVDGLAIKAT